MLPSPSSWMPQRLTWTRCLCESCVRVQPLSNNDRRTHRHPLSESATAEVAHSCS